MLDLFGDFDFSNPVKNILTTFGERRRFVCKLLGTLEMREPIF
jgi:hypothetical protein